MKHEKFFDVAVAAAVCGLHLGLLLLMMGTRAPSLSIGMPGMELVDLGDLNLGQAAVAAQAAPKIELPKEVEKKILTVKSKTRKADIVQKEKPKPKPEPEPEPKPQAEPVKADPNAAVAENRTGNASGGSATAAGGSQAGSGQGESQATHLGGHLRNPKPPYPPLSLENGEQGSVGLRVVVEADGYPSSVEMVKSSGYPRLDRSALKTVREKYRFTPATRLGMPVRSVYTFNIKFELQRR
ncbi:MAG: TonB family protein [Neisseria sp.]|nr:TonB family protein [Neisseria sp.]